MVYGAVTIQHHAVKATAGFNALQKRCQVIKQQQRCLYILELMTVQFCLVYGVKHTAL